MKIKICLIVLLLSLIKSILFAENIKILSFVPDTSHSLSNISPMKDSNGDLCAIVKIDIPIEGCKFDGFVVDSKFDKDSYILNISSQSKKITIKCPGLDTRIIDIGQFPEKKQLLPGGKYRVKVDLNETNKVDDNGNFVVINIIPNDLNNGILTIGDKSHDIKNGQVIDFLDYGQYTATASADGFQSKSETFNIIPDKTTTLDIYLNAESAKLIVECNTPESTIFINGKKKAKNTWQSSLPEGDYLVEVTKVGCQTYSEIIHLKKKETKNLTITLKEGGKYVIDNY